MKAGKYVQDGVLRERRPGAVAVRSRYRRCGIEQARDDHAPGEYPISVAASVAALFLRGVEHRRSRHRRRCAFCQRASRRSGDRRGEAPRRAGPPAVAADPHHRGCERRVSAHGLQYSEQYHRAPPQCRRHDRRTGAANREARHRHLRASGAHDALESRRGAGDARQQCRRRQGGRSRRDQDLQLRQGRPEKSRVDRARHWDSVSGRVTSTFIRPSRGPSSPSSGRTSSLCTSSTRRPGLPASLPSSRRRSPIRSARSSKAPAPFMSIPTASSFI